MDLRNHFRLTEGRIGDGRHAHKHYMKRVLESTAPDDEPVKENGDLDAVVGSALDFEVGDASVRVTVLGFLNEFAASAQKANEAFRKGLAHAQSVTGDVDADRAALRDALLRVLGEANPVGDGALADELALTVCGGVETKGRDEKVRDLKDSLEENK